MAVLASASIVACSDTETPTPGALASIVVTPAATLAINASQQYIAVGKDASGNVVDITPTWSVVASAGTISPSGLFTAGPVAGTLTTTVKETAAPFLALLP